MEFYRGNTKPLLLDLEQNYNNCDQTITGSFSIAHGLPGSYSLKITGKKYDPKYNIITEPVKEEFHFTSLKSKAEIDQAELWILAKSYGGPIVTLEYDLYPYLDESDVVYRNEIIKSWVNLNNHGRYGIYVKINNDGIVYSQIVGLLNRGMF